MTRAAQVAIVGGGVVGLSVAYELARRGRKPVVLDRGRGSGAASWAAAGMLAPVSEAELEEPPLVELGLDSLSRYPEFVRGIEEASGARCRFRQEGTLWAALDRDEAEELDHLEAAMRRKGLSAQRLRPEEILLREPHVSSRVVGGLLVEHDLQVDPRKLCAALEEAVRRLGGEVRSDSDVVAVLPLPRGGFRLELRAGDDRDCTAELVVLAAGAWASEGIRLPFDGLRVRPVKGQMVRLRGGQLLRHVVRSPECYVVPREDGELLIGATVEEQGFDLDPTAGAVHDLLRHAWRLLPGIYDLAISEISVGFRPALEDHLPAIGPCGIPGLHLACGHFRNGVLLAPATAHWLAETIETGCAQEALAAFAPARLGLRRRIRRRGGDERRDDPAQRSGSPVARGLGRGSPPRERARPVAVRDRGRGERKRRPATGVD